MRKGIEQPHVCSHGKKGHKYKWLFLTTSNHQSFITYPPAATQFWLIHFILSTHRQSSNWKQRKYGNKFVIINHHNLYKFTTINYIPMNTIRYRLPQPQATSLASSSSLVHSRKSVICQAHKYVIKKCGKRENPTPNYSRPHFKLPREVTFKFREGNLSLYPRFWEIQV